MSRLVDVYPYCKMASEVRFLIFRRAEDVMYARQWRMVGGKVRNGEKATDAAFREFNEETNINPNFIWVIPSINQFYDHNSDMIRKIPAFAAEVNEHVTVELNHEHSDYAWISEEEIENYIGWPEQKRLMKLVSKIVTDNQILEDWIL